MTTPARLGAQVRPTVAARPLAWALAGALALTGCATQGGGGAATSPTAPDAAAATAATRDTPAAAPAPVSPAQGGTAVAPAVDPHSYSEPAVARVTHLDLDLAVDFAAQTLSGRASLKLATAPGARRVILDTRDLDIRRVGVGAGDAETTFRLGEAKPFMGQALEIDLPAGADVVHVDYSTRPQAAALQWLAPEQTAGKHPFLFTQSQSILARTWIPLQDTPSVRFTYGARLRVPKELMAVMSADNPQQKSADGVYTFRMPQRIPSYLMALAVGDLAFRPLGADTGVYAEPSVVERSAWELADTQKMLEAASRRWGPYAWGRYDLLILPPSFPFGGMENPRLTFATPTIIAGDRSLVALVAHELAHSWSGNLVTNATWNDFWLNEGFTVYLEGRIMEDLYGEPYAEMLEVLGVQDLRTTMADLTPDDTRLKLELAGRDADEGTTQVAYEKGALFLRTIEAVVGRAKFEPFLRSWFDEHAFESVTTEDFLAYLDTKLLAPNGKTREDLQVAEWVYGPGIPSNASLPSSRLLAQVDEQIERWRMGAPAIDLVTSGWTTHQWVHFLRNLPVDIVGGRMQELDATFDFNQAGNSEVLNAWLLHVVRERWEPGFPALERFLTSMGRRKFLRPLYTEMAKTPEGLAHARQIYARARPTYHSVSTQTIDTILKWEEAAGG
jgi:leukotriene-A4 hydrolase